jgi:pimeloyl-ACP methyl ester carboxylesterase
MAVFSDDVLPAGVGSARVRTAQKLDMHYLYAGDSGNPVLLLLHGFPELAYSWRKVMPALAQAGFRVIAPDQRGYGRTTGWQDGYDVDLTPYRMPSLVLDQLALLAALDIDRVHAVIGHDFGSPVAAWCALIRPDVFTRVGMMSAPFSGPPAISQRTRPPIDQALGALVPPRKHYQWYYATPPADAEMRNCVQGLKKFLAEYYFLKSGLWSGNEPHPLMAWNADSLAGMPGYYIMPAGETMAGTVHRDAEGEDLTALASWLPDSELDVYVAEFGRTGFQGGLNWYRASVSSDGARSLSLYSGMHIDVPAAFIAGSRDWGIHQTPGAMKAMAERACIDFRGSTLIAGAGHWVQQEKPAQVVESLLGFLR